MRGTYPMYPVRTASPGKGVRGTHTQGVYPCTHPDAPPEVTLSKSLDTMPAVVRLPGGLVTAPDPDLLLDILAAAEAEQPKRARILARRVDAEVEVIVGDEAASVFIANGLVARLPSEAAR